LFKKRVKNQVVCMVDRQCVFPAKKSIAIPDTYTFWDPTYFNSLSRGCAKRPIDKIATTLAKRKASIRTDAKRMKTKENIENEKL